MAFDHYEIERQVISFMEANGITPPRDGLILDGQKHRHQVGTDKHGSKSGAYCIHTDGWPAGWVQDFHLGDPIAWKFDASGLDSNTRAEWKRRAGSPEAVAAQQIKKSTEEARRQEERRLALKSAWAAYQAAQPVKEACDHGYLINKHVQPRGGFPFGGMECGLRVGSMASRNGKQLTNLLLIPMMNIQTGRFCALHRVFGRPGADRRFGKSWATPAGGVFPIGVDVPSGPIFCCEGISTGLALYDYLIDELNELSSTVLMAMDAGNFARQAAAIRERYAGRELYAAIDDDEAGRKVASACRTAGFNGIIMPPLACREAV